MLRRLGFLVYLPWMLAQLGRGMLLPIVPLYLLDVGLSYTNTTVIIAAVGIGSVVGGLPVGSIAGRYGAELLFVGSVVLTGVTAAIVGVSTAVMALFVFRLFFGVGVFGLRVASTMLIGDATHRQNRGRAMSMMGGSTRLASFLGPIFGGFMVDLAGFDVAFVVCGIATLAGLIPFMVVRRERPQNERFVRPIVKPASLRVALMRHRSLLVLAGIGPALVLTVRQGRNVIVPLIGDDLGLGATAVGALISVGTGADLLLFPISGYLMDRFGRLFAIVPAFSLLGIGMLLLGLSSTAGGAIVAGVVMGIGNGVSAGTIATFSVDLAPYEDSGPFLSAMGMMQDLGVVIGPIIVGVLADSAGLGPSAIVLAIVMFVAIAWIVVVVGDTQHPTRPWIVSRLDRGDPTATN
jgi:MFS family permease